MKKIVATLLVIFAANCNAEVFEYPLRYGVLTVVEEPLNQAKFKKDYGEWSVNTMGWEGGRPPATQISSITYKTNKQNYVLESSHMFNALAGSLKSKLSDECMGTYCIVRGLFSNGTAAYAVQWVMRDGISRRSVLTSDPVVRMQVHKAIGKLQPKPAPELIPEATK